MPRPPSEPSLLEPLLKNNTFSTEILNSQKSIFSRILDQITLKRVGIVLVILCILYLYRAYFGIGVPGEDPGGPGPGSGSGTTPPPPPDTPSEPDAPPDTPHYYIPYKVMITTDISSIGNAEASSLPECQTGDCFHDKRHRFKLDSPFIGITSNDINNPGDNNNCKEEGSDCPLLRCSDGWAPSTSITHSGSDYYNHNYNFTNNNPNIWTNTEERISPYILDPENKKIYISDNTCSEQYCMLNYSDQQYHDSNSSIPTFQENNLKIRNDNITSLQDFNEYHSYLKLSDIYNHHQDIKDNIHCIDGFSHGRCTVNEGVVGVTEETCNQHNNNRPACELESNSACKYIDNYDNIKYNDFFEQSQDGSFDGSIDNTLNPRGGIDINNTPEGICRQLFNSGSGDTNQAGLCSINPSLFINNGNLLNSFLTNDVNIDEYAGLCSQSNTKDSCLNQSINISDTSKLNNSNYDNIIYFCNWEDIKEVNYENLENFCSNKCYPKISQDIDDLNRRPTIFEDSDSDSSPSPKGPEESPWIMRDNEMISLGMKDASSFIQTGVVGCVRNDIEYTPDIPDDPSQGDSSSQDDPSQGDSSSQDVPSPQDVPSSSIEMEPDCSSKTREECDISPYCDYNEDRVGYITTDNENYSFYRTPYTCRPPFTGNYRYLMCSDKYGCKTNDMDDRPDSYFTADDRTGGAHEKDVSFNNYNNYYYYKNTHDNYLSTNNDINLLDTVPNNIDDSDRYSTADQGGIVNGAFIIRESENTISNGKICNGGGNTFEIYSECTTQKCSEIMGDTTTDNCSRTDGYVIDETKSDNLLNFSLGNSLQDAINESCCERITCLNHNGFEKSETGFLCERDGEPWSNSRNYYKYNIILKFNDQLEAIPDKTVIAPLIRNIFLNVIPRFIQTITDAQKNIQILPSELDDDDTPHSLIKLLPNDPTNKLYKYEITIKNKSFTNLFDNGTLIDYRQDAIPGVNSVKISDLFYKLFQIQGEAVRGDYADGGNAGDGIFESTIFIGMPDHAQNFIKLKMRDFAYEINLDSDTPRFNRIISDDITSTIYASATDTVDKYYTPTPFEECPFIVEVENVGVPCSEGRCTHTQCCEIQTCSEFINYNPSPVGDAPTSLCSTGTQAIVDNLDNKVIDPFCFEGTKYIEINNFMIEVNSTPESQIGTQVTSDIVNIVHQNQGGDSVSPIIPPDQIRSILTYIDIDNPYHNQLQNLKGYIFKQIEYSLEKRIKNIIININDYVQNEPIPIITTEEAQGDGSENIKCKIYEDSRLTGSVTYRARIFISNIDSLIREDSLHIFEEIIYDLVLRNQAPDGSMLSIIPWITHDNQNRLLNNISGNISETDGTLIHILLPSEQPSQLDIDNTIGEHFSTIDINVIIQASYGFSSFNYGETQSMEEYDSKCLNYNLIHSETPQNSPCCEIITCGLSFPNGSEECAAFTPPDANEYTFYSNNIPQSSDLESSGCCGPQEMRCELPQGIKDMQAQLHRRTKSEYNGYQIANPGVHFPDEILIEPDKDTTTEVGYNLNAAKYPINVGEETVDTIFTLYDESESTDAPTSQFRADETSSYISNYALYADNPTRQIVDDEGSRVLSANLECSNFEDPNSDSGIRTMCIHIPDGDPRLYREPFVDSQGRPPPYKPEGHYFYVFTGCKSDQEAICRVPGFDQYNNARFDLDIGGVQGESRITNIDTLNYNEESGSYTTQCNWAISQSPTNQMQRGVKVPRAQIDVCSEEFGNIQISGCPYTRQFDDVEQRYNYSYYQELDVGINENIKLNSEGVGDNGPHCIKNTIDRDENCSGNPVCGNVLSDVALVEDDVKDYGICDNGDVCSPNNPCSDLAHPHCNRNIGGIEDKSSVISEITDNAGKIPSKYAESIEQATISRRSEICFGTPGCQYTPPTMGSCTPADNSLNGENRICSYISEENTCASKDTDNNVIMYPDEIHCIYTEGNPGACTPTSLGQSNVSSCELVSNNTCVKRDILSELSNTGVSGCTSDRCNDYGGECTGTSGEDEPATHPEKFSCRVSCDSLLSNRNDNDMTIYCENRHNQQILEYKLCNSEEYDNEYMCNSTSNCRWYNTPDGGECRTKLSLSPAEKPCDNGYFLRNTFVTDVSDNICSKFSGPTCISSGESGVDGTGFLNDNQCFHRMLNSDDLMNDCLGEGVDPAIEDDGHMVGGDGKCKYKSAIPLNSIVDYKGNSVYPVGENGELEITYKDLCNNIGLCLYDINTNQCNINHVDNISEDFKYHKCVPCGSETNNFGNSQNSNIVDVSTPCGTPNPETGLEQFDNKNIYEISSNNEHSAQFCSDYLGNIGFKNDDDHLMHSFGGVVGGSKEIRNLKDFYNRNIQCNDSRNVKYDGRVNAGERKFNKTLKRIGHPTCVATNPSASGAARCDEIQGTDLETEVACNAVRDDSDNQLCTYTPCSDESCRYEDMDIPEECMPSYDSRGRHYVTSTSYDPIPPYRSDTYNQYYDNPCSNNFKNYRFISDLSPEDKQIICETNPIEECTYYKESRFIDRNVYTESNIDNDGRYSNVNTPYEIKLKKAIIEKAERNTYMTSIEPCTSRFGWDALTSAERANSQDYSSEIMSRTNCYQYGIDDETNLSLKCGEGPADAYTGTPCSSQGSTGCSSPTSDVKDQNTVEKIYRSSCILSDNMDKFPSLEDGNIGSLSSTIRIEGDNGQIDEIQICDDNKYLVYDVTDNDNIVCETCGYGRLRGFKVVDGKCRRMFCFCDIHGPGEDEWTNVEQVQLGRTQTSQGRIYPCWESINQLKNMDSPAVFVETCGGANTMSIGRPISDGNSWASGGTYCSDAYERWCPTITRQTDGMSVSVCKDHALHDVSCGENFTLGRQIPDIKSRKQMKWKSGDSPTVFEPCLNDSQCDTSAGYGGDSTSNEKCVDIPDQRPGSNQKTAGHCEGAAGGTYCWLAGGSKGGGELNRMCESNDCAYNWGERVCEPY